MPSYFKELDGKVIYSGDGELIYYVPEKYFDLKVATIIGEYVEVMGVFHTVILLSLESLKD